MIKTVFDYIERHTDRKDELVRLREIALSLPFKECIKWGMPTYTVNGKNVVSIGSFKEWSCLWFHQGAFLEDKQSVLENAQQEKTKGMRQWRFADGSEINEGQVKAYLQEAIENQKAGKEIKLSKKSTKLIEIPVQLLSHLNSSPDHLKTFQSYTLSQQNEFSNYIIEAKRESTKNNRLEKLKVLLAEGKTLKVL